MSRLSMVKIRSSRRKEAQIISGCRSVRGKKELPYVGCSRGAGSLIRMYAVTVAAFVRTRLILKGNTAPTAASHWSLKSDRITSAWSRRFTAPVSRVLTNAATPTESFRLRQVLGVLFWLPAAVVPVWAAEEIPELRPPEDLLLPTWWEQHAWGVVLAVTCIVLGVALLVWWWLRPKPVVVIPPEAVARQALAALRDRPEDFPLLSEVSRIVRHYLARALDLRSEELTPEELDNQLANHPLLGTELPVALIEFFRNCDTKKFAPTPPPILLGAVAKALTFVDQVEARRRAAAQRVQAQAAAAPATPSVA